MDCSPPASSVHGISQARILEWVAISFSRGPFWPRDRSCICCFAGIFFTTESPGRPIVMNNNSNKYSSSNLWCFCLPGSVLSTCAGWHTILRYPGPNPWNLWMSTYVEKRRCRCDKIMNLETGRLSWIVRVSPKRSHRFRKAERGLAQKGRKCDKQRLEWCGHKPRNGNNHQKRQEERARLSSVAPSKNQLQWPPWLSFERLASGFWPPGL